ncbi:peptidoglycan DD-metalloendopeptidase family protein [Caldimonas tepidiphila]|uniref:peptidoglycan DD-metalloendopeptidase family protein n=1 Tax=Caldimonas tepidiphila TaxID=2315841 RepID=UPI000E5A1619|nr:peptidoglycan DD-metalloendopeptidase family protein [Caldimonas tepidiphila]
MRWKLGVCVLAACVLAGCASPSHRAPVEDRATAVRRAPGTGVAAARPTDPAVPLPGAENAGKPGYYTVKPGDTLIRIGLDSGQNWRDIVRWNGLENPNVIEVGQVLRVVPPNVDPMVASVRPVSPTRVESRPLDTRPGAVPGAAGVPVAASAPVPVAASAPAIAGSAPSAPAPVGVVKGDDDIAWAWPAAGSVISGFDEARNKGLGIAGKAGDAVLAAADGRVVYAGSGLRGYGNLVIVKHNNTYLTAYAHNQTLLVKEDQTVRRGQKIAEMGATDADRVKLHFEIRRQGKPVDPAKFLPPR